MSGNSALPPVGSEEWLSRYILHKSYVRHDNTLKADPFIPHPHADLSVTRHLGLHDAELWDIGRDVARQTHKTLHGRAENQAMVYQGRMLTVAAASVPGNPNHANVTGWPKEKPRQKMLALEIAADSEYIPYSS